MESRESSFFLKLLIHDEKAAILAVKPEDLVAGVASGSEGGCDVTCGESCTSTCGPTCPSSGMIPDKGEEVIQPPQAITSQELTSQIIKSIGKNFSRFRR